MNPPQVLVRTCLTTHIYTQEKAASLRTGGRHFSVFYLFTHATVDSELSITPKSISEIFSSNVESLKESICTPYHFYRKAD